MTLFREPDRIRAMTVFLVKDGPEAGVRGKDSRCP